MKPFWVPVHFCASLLVTIISGSNTLAQGDGNALQKAQSLLNQLKPSPINGIEVATVAKSPKLENTAWIHRTGPLMGGVGVRFISEDLIVLLPDSKFVKLYGSPNVNYFREDGVHASELVEKGKWKFDNATRSLQLYDVEYKDKLLRGGYEVKRRDHPVEYRGVRNEHLSRGEMYDERFDFKRINDRQTAEALQRAATFSTFRD